MDTELEKLNNMFYGSYLILPGQFQMLDKQIVTLTKESLRILVRGGSRDTVYNFSVNEIQQMYYKGLPLKAIRIRVDSMSSVNAEGPNNLTNLFTMALGMKTPTTLYISYDTKTDIFTLKNSQYSTIFIMRKTSSNQPR